MQRITIFVTGTDTGAGKTVLAALLARRLGELGVPVAALKPICTGGREDAVVLRRAQAGSLSLEEVNPWHFRAPVAPLLAARRQGRELRLGEVVAHVRRFRRRFPVVLVEGAGGLLSPLGEGFNARDLIRSLRARTLVVCPNRLGAVNQSLLVRAALPGRSAQEARFVLMGRARRDRSGRSNAALLAEALGGPRVHVLPWLGRAAAGGLPIALRKRLDAILQGCGISWQE